MIEPTTSEGGNPHILAIAPSQSNLEYYRATLDHHANFRLIATPRELEPALRERQWDVILCDFNTTAPAEILAVVKQQAPATPLIFVADSATVPDAVAMMRLGARGFVDKAYPQQLVTLVEEELQSIAAPYTNRSNSAPDIIAQQQAESELRFHSAILQNMAEGVQIVRPSNGTFVYVNPAFEHMFGYEPGELIGQHVSILNDPAAENPRDVAERITQILLDTGEWRGEVHNVRKDGSRFFSSARIITFDHAEFGPVWITVQQDITARKIAESELRFHSAILQNMAEGVHAVRDSDGMIVYANPNLEAMFGYEPGELVGQHVATLMNPNVQDAEQAVRNLLDLLDESGTWNGELQRIRKDGTPFWSSNSIIPFEHPEFGKVWINVQQDITTQKAAQDALNHQATLLEQISDVVILMDKQHLVTAWNRAATTTYGWTEAEVIGQPVHMLLQSQFISATTDEIDVALETTGNWRGHVVEKTRSGGSVHALVSISRLYRQGEFVGYIAVNRDITATHRRDTFQHNIATVLEAIANAEPLPDVLTKLVQAVEEYQPIIRASVLLADTETETLQHGAAPSLPEGYCKAIDGAHYASGEGSCGTAAAEKRLVIVEDIQTDPLWKNYRDLAGQYDLRACWSQPILGDNGVVLGTFALYYDHIRTPSADELELIGLAGHVAGIAIRRIKAEDALRASEERYRNVVQDQSELVCRYTADLLVTFGNRAYCEMFGVPQENIVGQSILTRIPPEEHERVFGHVRALTPENPYAVSIHHGLGFDGSLRWTEWKDRAIFDEQGQIIEYQGVGRDITEQRRAEEALRASEERYRSIIEDQTEFVVRYDDQIRVTFANSAYCRAYGYTPETVVGADILATIPAEAHDRMWAYLHSMTPEHPTGFSAHPSTQADGKVHWVEWKDRAVLDEQGRIIEYQGVGRDITEQKQAEEALRASEEKYRSLVESSDALIMMLSLDGTILYSNAIAATHYRSTPEAIVGSNFRDLYPSDVLADRKAKLDEVVRTGQGLHFEARSATHDQELWFSVTLQPIRDDTGQIVAAFINSQDITDRKRTEEALRASEAKYRSLIESSDSRIMMLGPDGTILFTNEIAAAHYHTTPEALTGKTLRDIYPPEIADGRLAFLDSVFSSGQGITTEIRSSTYQEPRWFRSAVQPVRDGNGQIYAILSNSIDITDRKLAEEALRASEEHFRFLFKNNPHPMWVYDRETLAFLEVNDSAVERYGYTHEEFLTMRLTDIRPAEDVARLVEDTAQARPVIQHSGEWRHKLKNGQVIPVEITSHTLSYAGRQAALVVAQDITERKQAEEALAAAHALLEQRVVERTEELERSKDRIEAIFNHSGDGILLLDLQHGIQQTNYAFDQMFNLPPDSAVGMGLPQFFDVADTDHIAQMVQEVAQTHQTVQIEARALRLGGTTFAAEISLAPVNRSDKAVSNLVCIVRDVSERKQAQDALAKYAAEVYDLYHFAPTGYHSLDKDGTIVRINNTELIWLGYAENEIVGKLKFTDIIAPSSLETARKHFPIFMEQGHLSDLELEFVRKDGSTFWGLVNATAVYDEHGQLLHSRSSLMDITELKQVQRAVAEERNLLRTVIDTVPNFIYVKDMQHRMILNNVAHAATLGVGSPAEAIGKTDLEMFPRELAEKFHADEDRIFATGEPMLRVEERSRGRHGGEIWALTTKIPLRNLNGEMIGLVGTTHDVTDMKLSEQALRRSEADLLSVINSTTTMFVLVDRDGTIRLVNRLAQAASMAENGQPLGVGTLAIECIPEQFHDNFHTRFARVLQGEHITEVFSALRLGTPTSMEFRYYPVRDQDGHVIGMTIAADDITERKATEQQLRYLASLQDQMYEAVIGVTLDYRVQSWNKAAERMYGWTAEEVLGKVSSDVLRSEPVSGESIAEVRATLNEAGFWRGETIHYHRDGTPVWVSATVSTIYDADGKPDGYIIVGHDITAQKAAERVIEQKRQQELEMQGYLKALHEITIGLTRANTLDDFYRLTVQEGMEHFGFERMGLLLLDRTDGAAIGTYGTDATGTIIPQHHLRIEPDSLTGILKRTLDRHERVAYDEHAHLFANLEQIGEGQNAVAALWNGEVLGWLAVDNAVYHVPISQAQLDILALYALTAGSLLTRKRAEFALRESEARYRFLAENIHDVIIKMTIEGQYTYVSPSTYNLTQHLPEEILGASPDVLLHPDDWQATLAMGQQVMQSGGTYFTIVVRLLHKQGHYVWVEVNNTIVHDIETGAPIEIISLVHDVTERKAAEDALRDSEERYRLLAENVHDVIIKSDADGLHTYVSPASRELVGYAPEELIGISTAEFVHPDDRADLADYTGRIIEIGGNFLTFVHRLRRKDGDYVWVESTTTVVRDAETGLPREFISLVRDITERKAAVDALRESEARYRLLAENVQDVIVRFDANFVRTYATPSTKHLVGYDPEEIYGQSLGSLTHPDDVALLKRSLDEAVQSGATTFSLPIRLVHKDGHAVWVEVNATIVREVMTGAVLEFIAIIHDITERKAAEDALRQSEANFRKYVESAPLATIISDDQGQIVVVNGAAEQLFGYPRDALVGQPIEVLVPDEMREDHADHRTRYESVPASRRRHPLELRARRQDGTVFPADVQLSEIDTQPTPMVMSLIIDVTERKAAELALQQALEQEREMVTLKSRFVSMASHEFRTPLAAILATTDTLTIYRDRMDAGQIDKRLDKIRQQVNHMKDIMEEVLELARIQAGRVEFKPSTNDLDAICQEIIEEFDSQADYRGRMVYTSPDSPLMASFDRRLMRQIISNLISNGLKYSPGEKPVHMALIEEAEQWVLTVRDEGIGIPAKDIKHLFEPFHRASNVGTISGTGLGLSITKQAVDLHRGTIIPESIEGVGTTFTVTLPKLRENAG